MHRWNMKWINNFTHTFYGCNHLSILRFYLIHVSKRGPRWIAAPLCTVLTIVVRWRCCRMVVVPSGGRGSLVGHTGSRVAVDYRADKTVDTVDSVEDTLEDIVDSSVDIAVLDMVDAVAVVDMVAHLVADYTRGYNRSPWVLPGRTQNNHLYTLKTSKGSLLVSAWPMRGGVTVYRLIPLVEPMPRMIPSCVTLFRQRVADNVTQAQKKYFKRAFIEYCEWYITSNNTLWVVRY